MRISDKAKIEYLEASVEKLTARIRELEGADVERTTEILEAMHALGATEGESLQKVAYRAADQLSMMNAALAKSSPK